VCFRSGFLVYIKQGEKEKKGKGRKRGSKGCMGPPSSGPAHGSTITKTFPKYGKKMEGEKRKKKSAGSTSAKIIKNPAQCTSETTQPKRGGRGEEGRKEGERSADFGSALMLFFWMYMRPWRRGGRKERGKKKIISIFTERPRLARNPAPCW